MQSADREEFVTQLQKLCAGFNVPFTEARQDAYWAGLSRLSLGQFARCVDTALGDEGPEKFPTVHGIWEIHKKARARSASSEAITRVDDDPDHLAYFANRLLFQHALDRDGLGSAGRFVPGHGMTHCTASAELQACLNLKRELVAEFLGYVREGDDLATPREFVRRWVYGLRQVSAVEEATLIRWRKLVNSPDARAPFPPYMARELSQTQDAELAVA